MSTRRIKFIAWVVAIIAAWKIVTSPATTKAVMLFCLDGTVPGMHKNLSPDAVFGVLGGLFAVAVFLIFFSEWRKLARFIWRHRPGSRAAKPAFDRSIQSTQTDSQVDSHIRTEELLHNNSAVKVAGQDTAVGGLPVVRPGQLDQHLASAIPPRHVTAFQTQPKPPIVITHPGGPGAISRLMNRLAPWSAATRAALRMAALTASVAGLLLAGKLQRAFMRFARNGSHVAARELLRAFFYLRIWSIELWKWLKPHLQNFDAWLELQVQARHGDTTRTMAAVVREGRKGMRELKSSLDSARKQTHADTEEHDKLLGDSDSDAL